jgi:tripartite-type tricarboxylate transporter receptor subunit TctC
MSADNLPGAGGAEALGRPAIALHLGHAFLSLLPRNVTSSARIFLMANYQ